MLLFFAVQVASAATASAPPTPPSNEKMVCRRVVETGSLLKSRKVCMSRDRWNRASEDQRRLSEDMVRDNARMAGGGS